MNTMKSIQIVLIALSFSTAPTLVHASGSAAGYEEVSYDELVQELHAKKRKVTAPNENSLDDVKLYAGVGYANSFTQLSIPDHKVSQHATGIQVSLGMELFHSNWYTEGVFRNYGLSTTGSEEFSLKELDLKLGFVNKLSGPWSVNIATGLSNRFLKYSDSSKQINISETTPSFVVSSGMMAQLHKNISLGAEIGARTAFTDKTSDKNSLEFALRLTTSL